jgi:aryl carrier-like protein
MDNSVQKPRETTKQRPDLSTPYAAPRSHIEKSITHIWQRLSGFDQIGIDDDFFEIGGDSLKAVALISEIKKIGYHAALTDILSNPTVKKLTAVIDEKNIPGEVKEENEEERLLSQLECIEKLNKGRNQENIFIIHPMHGMVNQYKDLALLLEKKYNVYGIQARGVKPGSKMSESPGQMIDDYLEQILAVQKNGPFIIAGYCISAIISYEIVRKMESLDHPVEKLILFDSHALFRDRFLRILRALEYLPGFVKRVILFFYYRKFKKAKQAGTFGKIEGSDGEEIKWGNDLRKKQFEKYMGILGNHVLPLIRRL